MRPIRTQPAVIPDTRDRADHWTTQVPCITDEGIQAMIDVVNFPKSLIADAEAKSYCKRCNFKERCLEEYDERVAEGVIGGLNEQERKALRQGKVKRTYYSAARKRGAA